MVPPNAEASEESARACLERVLASREFARAVRLKQLLEFVGRETLAGRGGELKEAVLAVEVFGRDGSFDSQQVSVVRVAIRNLRARLERYYADEGREDAVRIEIPLNSYAPVFSAVKPELAATGPRRPVWWVAAVGGFAILTGLIVSTGWRGRIGCGIFRRRRAGSTWGRRLGKRWRRDWSGFRACG